MGELYDQWSGRRTTNLHQVDTSDTTGPDSSQTGSQFVKATAHAQPRYGGKRGERTNEGDQEPTE